MSTESAKKYSITGSVSLTGSDYEKFERMLERALPELSRTQGVDVLMIDAKVDGGTIRYVFDSRTGDLRSVGIVQ